MNKTAIIVGVVTLLIIGLGAYFLTKPKAPVELPSYDQNSYLYFWGDGCPHCAAVAEFFDSWEGKDKIQEQKFEVWYNKSNQALMTQQAEEVCHIPKTELAVPLLVTPEGKCYKGDQSIIDLYKSLKF